MTKKNNWISVNDQLPPDKSPFIGTDGDKIFAAYYIEDVEEYRVGGWECCMYCGGFSRVSFSKKCYTIATVTHWMPLPQLPQQEKNDNLDNTHKDDK